jgi:type IV pilus assembly protein PilF
VSVWHANAGCVRRAIAMHRWTLGALLAALVAGCVASGNTGTKSNGNAAAINLQLGIAYLKQGDLATAKEKLERARMQDPSNAQIRSALALLYERLGNDADADEQYRSAQKLAPDDPDVLNNYAIYLCRRGRVDEGVRRFEQAAKNRLYRTPWSAYTNAGVCLHNAKRDAEAQARFERALRFNPSYAEAAVQLASLNLMQQRYTAAQATVEDFLARNDATADLLLLGWRVAQAQQDQDRLERYAQRLIKEFPNSEQARVVVSSGANRT